MAVAAGGGADPADAVEEPKGAAWAGDDKDSWPASTTTAVLSDMTRLVLACF